MLVPCLSLYFFALFSQSPPPPTPSCIKKEARVLGPTESVYHCTHVSFCDALHALLLAHHRVLLVLLNADWLGESGEDGPDHRPVCLGLPVPSLPGQEGQQGLPQHPQVSKPYAHTSTGYWALTSLKV